MKKRVQVQQLSKIYPIINMVSSKNFIISIVFLWSCSDKIFLVKQEITYEDNIEIISTGEDSTENQTGVEIVRLPESSHVTKPKVKEFNPSRNKWYKVSYHDSFAIIL